MKTIRVKQTDLITDSIIEETFVFCYELGKGFIKRNISRLNLEVYTFENIVAEIEAMTFEQLTSTGFDSILFVNGSINESKKITETVQTELNLIPIGTHTSFVDELIDTKKTKSRYFDITRAAPIKVILGNANFISDTNIQIVENISVGTAVSSDLILIKQDNYNYTLENYTDTFEFVNGILKTKGSIDYETRINYVLQIKISDKVDPTKFWNDIVNVEVINVPDTISINPSRTLTIDENSSNGTVIGDLTALFTKEIGLNVSFTLNNNGEKFGISGNNLVVNGVLDYETVPQYIVTVKITNTVNINMFWTMDVTVNVNNLVEGPIPFSKVLFYAAKTFIVSSTATVLTSEFTSNGTGRVLSLAGANVGTNVLFYGGYSTAPTNLVTLLSPTGTLIQPETRIGTSRYGLAGVSLAGGMIAHGGRNDAIAYALAHTTLLSATGTLLKPETNVGVGQLQATPGAGLCGTNALFHGGYQNGGGSGTNVTSLLSSTATLVMNNVNIGTARREESGAFVESNAIIYGGYVNYTNAVTMITPSVTLARSETFIGTVRASASGANVGTNALFFGGNKSVNYTTCTLISPTGTLVQPETNVGGTITQATGASL